MLKIRDKTVGIQNRVLTIILIAAVSAALGVLGYTIANPPAEERFTEFYLSGLEGKAVDYPTELKVVDEGRVIVGIINREHENVTYHVEITIDGVKNTEMGSVTLEHGEKWEEVASFVPKRVGNDQKVEFLLYRLGQDDVYRRIHLWTDIIAGKGQNQSLTTPSS